VIAFPDAIRSVVSLAELSMHDWKDRTMPARSRPVVLEGDLIFGRGKLKKVDAAFLEAFSQHFQEVGLGIFQKMYDQQPARYFNGLIALAKAGLPLHVKHEIGAVGDFEGPSKVDQVLDKMEERAGPAAREMLRKMLDQIAEAEKKYIESQPSGEWKMCIRQRVNV
jgi:hypothetical protein